MEPKAETKWRFVVGLTTDKNPVISGEEIFRLKDELGFPFAMSFMECEKRGVMIDWVGLIEAARQRDWWDFQIYDSLNEAFADSQAWPEKRPEIMELFKSYVMTNKHPNMALSP